MKKWLACFLIAAMMLGGFASAASAPKTRDFVFIMDVSFSMEGVKLESMKENVIRAIDTIFSQAPNARIALIGYSNLVYDIADFKGASAASELKQAVEKLEAIVDTDIVEPIQLAQRKLMRSTARQKVAVFFGDGVPRDSLNDIRKAADGLKSAADVYTIGLFQGVSAAELPKAEEIMRIVSTDLSKCYFTESPYQLELAMDDILDEAVFDRDRIQITLDVACEVMIEHNGEILDQYNPRASFGRILSDGIVDGKKIVRLWKGVDYDVVITAKKEADVTFTIQYSDANGVFTDTRVIAFIPVRRGSVMYTNTSSASLTYLSVDRNNDGLQDDQYAVGQNGVMYASTPQRVYLANREVGMRLRKGMVDAYATSHLPARPYGTYEATNAIDGNKATSWVEDGYGNGQGESITFTFDETEVTGFVIQAGMFTKEESYWRNTRVRTLNVYADGMGPFTVELKDEMIDQIVLFEPAVTTSFLKLELVDFYTAGAEGQDTCISDVWILTQR